MSSLVSFKRFQYYSNSICRVKQIPKNCQINIHEWRSKYLSKHYRKISSWAVGYAVVCIGLYVYNYIL
jgi:hypothetical protein